MTNEHETDEQSADENTAAEPDKPVDKQSTAAGDIDLRSEQDRRVIIFASALLMLLAAPVFLPVERDHSFWYMARHDATGRVMLIGIFGWPVCLGLFGIVRGLKRAVPGKILIGTSTAITLIQALGTGALVAMILKSEYRDAHAVYVWAGVAALTLALGAIARSFFVSGWRRFQHILATMALLAMTIVLELAATEPRAFVRVAMGGWLFFFATAALVPFAAITLTSREA
ncbi:MAG: hypothetical protein IPM54_06940 [Polyangiaceae bacterium]|nr:hypothetical protein [Polyangiaceae bacterium]